MNTIIATKQWVGTSGEIHASVTTLEDVDRSDIGDRIDWLLAQGFDSFRVVNHFQG